ncbi:MAG: hypothetical protein M1829_002780 [Trizodia sp. TS-e1964]|nr:MAG: hypothetical protein M1829_002780 [Trizodia sp. TS-e1964]
MGSFDSNSLPKKGSNSLLNYFLFYKFWASQIYQMILDVSTPVKALVANAGIHSTDPKVSTLHSLSRTLEARKADFTRRKSLKVKIGSWNVAALPGTERDVGGWFVGGKGVAEALAGLEVKEVVEHGSHVPGGSSHDSRESVNHQEHRANPQKSTIPKRDTGTLPGGDDIDIYALGLQEIVDITSPTEALRPYADNSAAEKWKNCVANALPKGFKLVAEQQLMGLLLLVYASGDLFPTISSVSTSSVGTGFMGYMGNKGAVAIRIVLGETTRLVFINCHMAAGADKAALERRNWDANQIASRIRFTPITTMEGVSEEMGDSLGDEDFAWWFGDLNYRLESIPGDDVRRLLMLHTQNEYNKIKGSAKKIQQELTATDSPPPFIQSSHPDDHFSEEAPSSMSSSMIYPGTLSEAASTTSSIIQSHDSDHLDPSQDPSSLQTTLASLLPHDQLRLQQAAGQAFHDGWQEGPILFLPTYKYDVGSVGMFDSSEKRRGPSWCDRILFRTRQGKLAYEKKIHEVDESRKRDSDMSARGIDEAGAEDSVLFDYDPETDGANTDDDQFSDTATHSDALRTKEESDESIRLDAYASHQRVLSSDHKPLTGLFTISYPGVDPALKAIVYQGIARDLDKAENEERPGVTVVVDQHLDNPIQNDGAAGDEGRNTPEGANFGEVRYNQPKFRNITIANTGRVSATIGFIGRPSIEGDVEGVTPPWLTLKFEDLGITENEQLLIKDTPDSLQKITLEPGEAINAVLKLRVRDFELVRLLNSSKAVLDDVLILRVTNGRDHFIPVHGIWLPSCIGRSINQLIRVPERGVRALPPPPHDLPESSPICCSVPRELLSLITAVEETIEHFIAEVEMTGSPTNKTTPHDSGPLSWPFTSSEDWVLVNSLQRNKRHSFVLEALDTGQPISALFPPDMPSQQRLEAVAGTLVSFLRSLSDGIIPVGLWKELQVAREKISTSLTDEEQRNIVLDVLSTAPNHSISFVFVTSMLARVAAEMAPLPSPGKPVMPDSVKPMRRHSRTSSTVSLTDEMVTRRHLVEMAYARIFAEALVRCQMPAQERDRKAVEERRTEVVAVFLRMREGQGSSSD